METTIIEPDTTPVESNVGGGEVQDIEPASAEGAGEVTETAEQPTEEVETQQEEPTVELEGEKVPLSQVKKWKEDYANDSKWRDKNRRESEELNRQKERYKRLELLEPMLEQHPEVLQTLFTQTKQRDFDAELRNHYLKRPTADPQTGYVDINAYNQWEYQKDILLAERTESMAERRATDKMQQTEAKTHNEKVEADAYDEFVKSGKMTVDEFQEAARWIIENVAIKNGKVPSGSFNVAYKQLHEERWLSEMKLKEAKKAVEPVLKAQKGMSEPGKKKSAPNPANELTPQEDEFVKRAKERNPHYQRLP